MKGHLSRLNIYLSSIKGELHLDLLKELMRKCRNLYKWSEILRWERFAEAESKMSFRRAEEKDY